MTSSTIDLLIQKHQSQISGLKQLLQCEEEIVRELLQLSSQPVTRSSIRSDFATPEKIEKRKQRFGPLPSGPLPSGTLPSGPIQLEPIVEKKPRRHPPNKCQVDPQRMERLLDLELDDYIILFGA